jgi:hypothetical protein
VERVALMLAANDLLDERDATPEELVLRVHVLHALGRPAAALDLARAVLRHWQPVAMAAGSGLPLVPPERTDLRLVPQGTQRDWLRQRLAEYVARRSAWSSCLQQGSVGAWAMLMSDPDRSPESEQRYLLKHLLADSVPSISALRWLPNPAHTANPAIWRALIDTSRILAPATAVAAMASPGGSAKATRPHMGSALASPGILTEFTALFDLPNTLLRT